MANGKPTAPDNARPKRGEVGPGRPPRGRQFKPGNPGKPKGTRNRITLAVEALLAGEHEALTRKAIEKALEGDTVALRLCLDRIAPPRKDAPVSIDLPPVKSAADVLAASSKLLEELAATNVTPDEAGRIMALLVAHRGIVETHELEARIIALETRDGKPDQED